MVNKVAFTERKLAEFLFCHRACVRNEPWHRPLGCGGGGGGAVNAIFCCDVLVAQLLVIILNRDYCLFFCLQENIKTPTQRYI